MKYSFSLFNQTDDDDDSVSFWRRRTPISCMAFKQTGSQQRITRRHTYSANSIILTTKKYINPV